MLAAAATARLISAETAAFWQIVTAIGLTVTPLLAKLGRDAGAPGRARGQPMRARYRADARRAARGHHRLRAGRAAGRGDAHRARQALCRGRFGHRPVDAGAGARATTLIFGDAARPELLDRLNLGHATAVILTMDDPVQAVRRSPAGARPVPRSHRSSPAPATPITPPSSTAPAPPTRCPRRSNPRCSCREAVLVDLGVAMGPVIASIHEKRDELREQICEVRRARPEEPGASGTSTADGLRWRQFRHASAARTASSASCGLVAVRAAALRHVRPPAAALAAERLDRDADQVDRVDRCGQVVGHADGDRGAALVDRDDRRDARAEPLLGLVEQPAQSPWGPCLRAPGRRISSPPTPRRPKPARLAAAAERERLLRLGQFALEPVALVDAARRRAPRPPRARS